MKNQSSILIDENKDYININIQSKDGFSALHFAAYGGYLEIAEFLVNIDTKLVSQKTNNESTPLHVAVRYGHKKVVEFLVEVDEGLINQKNQQGWTALHIATQHGYITIVKSLLEKGANPNIYESAGLNSLDILFTSSVPDTTRLEIQSLLRKHGALDSNILEGKLKDQQSVHSKDLNEPMQKALKTLHNKYKDFIPNQEVVDALVKKVSDYIGDSPKSNSALSYLLNGAESMNKMDMLQNIGNGTKITVQEIIALVWVGLEQSLNEKDEENNEISIFNNLILALDSIAITDIDFLCPVGSINALIQAVASVIPEIALDLNTTLSTKMDILADKPLEQNIFKAFFTIEPKDIGNWDQLKLSWEKVTNTLNKDSYFSIKSSGLYPI